VNAHGHAPRRPAGFTLVEMMISMAIGLVLILGAVTIYANGRQNFQTFENLARLQDNARFALDLIAPDIRLAGFWGRTGDAALVERPAGVTVTCGDADVTPWALDLRRGIAAVDDGYSLPCPAHDAPQPETDVLIVRRAGTAAVAPAAGRLQLQSNRSAGTLFDDGLMPAGYLPAPASVTHDVVLHAYYVDRSSSVADLPSLRRQTLVAGGLIEDEEVIPGVENLQVQLGVDTDRDGMVERYVDADHAILTPGTAEFMPDAEIRSVRLWLLLRSEQREQTYTGGVTYTLPDRNLPPITPDDGRRRLQLSSTVYLRNH
jgi:type IV pilus assembly protein PilW